MSGSLYKRFSKILIILALISLTAVQPSAGQASNRHARSGPRVRRQSPTTESRRSASYLSLIHKLRARGATVKRTNEKVSQPFFSVTGRNLMVNGETLQVFEYASPAAAESEAKRVNAIGTAVGTATVTWIAAPHFYRSGRLIVLYIGDNEATIKVLTAVLGPQFAGVRTAENRFTNETSSPADDIEITLASPSNADFMRRADARLI